MNMTRRNGGGAFTAGFRWTALAAATLLSAFTSFAGITIVSLKGEVTVRHGASEEWVSAARGDVLRPEDSIRLEEGAAATVLLDSGDSGGGGGRRIDLPPLVIVDIADLRNMTRNDLLMKLAMEDVRSAPAAPAGEGVDMPRTTTTRGSDREEGPARQVNPGPVNALRLNGAKVLHDNGFYGPCVLRSREILRIEPALASRIGPRLLMADALEKMNLNAEAYDVYRSLAGERLPGKEKSLVEEKLRELKK